MQSFLLCSLPVCVTIIEENTWERVFLVFWNESQGVLNYEKKSVHRH